MVFPEGAKIFLLCYSFGVPLTSYPLSYSGKTSLIHSLAGELGLDIYVVSLSAKGSVFHIPASFQRS